MPGLAALAALLAAAPARAATTIIPKVRQCDETYAAGSTTRHPLPLVRADISDPVGLKIGTPNRLGIVTGATRALWRFDSGVAIGQTTETGAVSCSPSPSEDRLTFDWDYTDPDGTQRVRLGTCVYEGDCSGTSTYVLNSGLSRVPVSLGACPATPPATGATTVFAASTLDASRMTNMATFNGSQMAISNVQTVDWQLGPTYTLAAWIRANASGTQRVLSAQDASQYWGFGLSASGALRHFDSRDASPDVSMGSGLDDGGWHLIHVVRDNSPPSRRFYIDGRFAGSAVATSTNSFTLHPIASSAAIGAFISGSEYFNGNIDDVRVLTVALSTDDVRLEYQATSHYYSSDGGVSFSTTAGSYTPSTPPTGSVGPFTYVPGEAWTSSSRWIFLAQDVNSDSALSAAYAPARDTSPPNPPGGFAGAPTTANDVTWSWSAPDKYCGPPTSAVSYTLVDPATGLDVNPPGPLAHPTFSVGESFAGGPNQLRSRAIKAADMWGTSALTAAATVYTLAAAPVSLSFSNVSSGSFTASWSANGNPSYTRFEVSWSLDDFASPFVTTRASLGDDFTAASAGVGGLSPGTTVYVRVRAYSGRSSDFYGGAPTSYLSGAVVTLPAAPALSATALSNSSVRYDWSPVSGAAGYTLYAAGGAPVLYAGGGLTYTSSTLDANAPYGAQVEAVSPSGPGPRSSAWVFTHANAPTLPATPSVNATSVTFAWSASGNPAYTFYELNVATDAAFGVVVATIAASTTQATATGLFPGTAYYARARAVSGSQALTAFLPFGPVVTRSDAGITRDAAPASPYAPAGALAGQWHFDEGAGASAADLSGNGNAALLTCASAGCASTPTFAGGPPGLGYAASFSGLQDGLVRVPDAPSLGFAGDVTVAAWACPSQLAQPDGAGIVARGDGGAEDFALEVSGSRFRFKFAPATVVTAPAAIAAGAWTHLIGSYDAAAGSATLYVDGRAAATVTGVAARNNLAHDLSIGNRQSAASAYDRGFLGRVDGVRLFNRAFTAAEALAEYAGNFVSTVSVSPPNDRVRVGLPPNAFGAQAVLYVSANPAASPVRVSPAALDAGLASPPDGVSLVPRSVVEIVPVVGGLPFTQSLGSSATVSIAYDDADGDNLVDGTSPGLPASAIRMYTLNTTVNRWEELPTFLDAAGRRAVGLTPHFSVFALFAPRTVGSGLAAVRAYPVPWKPGSGGPFDGSGVVFDRLPASGSVSILSLSGESVAEFSFDGAAAGRAVWDGRSAAGRRVASGLYYARVKSGLDGSTALLRLAIER